MRQKQKITLRLGVYSIQFEIDPSKEEIYRRATLLLNERFSQFRKRLDTQTTSEYIWICVALDCCVNLLSDYRDKALEPVIENINEINRMLEDVLKNNTALE